MPLDSAGPTVPHFPLAQQARSRLVQTDGRDGAQMYAIVKTGGKQLKAEAGETLIVEKIDGEPGTAVTLSEVLMVVKGSDVTVGTPFVKGAKVRAEIVRQGKAKKIEAFNYKPKKNVRKRWGHRQPQTHLKVVEVIGG
jgi:large subunit ribosomal protein L21